MARVDPAPAALLEEFQAFFEQARARSGYAPNSLTSMAWRPEIARAFQSLFGAVMREGDLDPGLKQMAAQVASTASGCRYCQAHTATGAAHAGVEEQKVAALFEFETSPLFSEAERAVLRLARDAAIVPNATTEEHFEALRAHFSEAQIVELVAAISVFGFLNRWNDTMATELEDVPLEFASTHLHEAGWEPGKHRSD